MTTALERSERAYVAQKTNGSVERDWIALLEPAAKLASQVAGTGFVPSAMRGNPAAIVAAILYGDELGLGPMQSLAKIAVIEGKPALYAEAQRALILAAGHEIWIDEATQTKVTVSGRRSGSERTSSVTWTIDDAKRANLAGKSNWRTYPRQMLTARATAELARVIFADVIGGLAATEELEDSDLELPIAIAAPDKGTTRKRRRKSVATVTETPETAGEETGEETITSPDLPPLPDVPAEPPVEPAPDTPEPAGDEPEPGEPRPEEPADGQIGFDESAPADDAGGVAQDEETTAASEPADSAGTPPADTATKPQLKALDALVGRLRETEVELEDAGEGYTAPIVTTEQLWAAAATRRGVAVDDMVELLNGRDVDGALHWAPLRDSLTKSEASDLMTKLVDRARKWGVE